MRLVARQLNLKVCKIKYTNNNVYTENNFFFFFEIRNILFEEQKCMVLVILRLI